MIKIINGTLRFLEAKAFLEAQKENKLFAYILNLYIFSLLVHIFIMLPLFFSLTRLIMSITGVCIASLLPFAILLFRIILFTGTDNKLNKIIEYYEKDFNSFKNMIASGIKANMAACSVFYIFFLVYSFFMYGILSLILTHSLFPSFIPFLLIVLACGLVLIGVFLHHYLKGKDLLWPKIILPVLSCILTFLLLLVSTHVFPLHPLFIYMCSFSSGWFFTFPLFKKLLEDKKLITSFRFILSCYIIILILFLASTITRDMFYGSGGIPFLEPVLNTLASVSGFIHTYFISNMVFAVLFPHLFVPVLLLGRTIYNTASLFRQKLTPCSFKNREHESIFSGSLSMYHLLWFLFRSTLITWIVYIEIDPVSDLVFSLVKMFKIPEIFHLDFLTRDTISFFFTLLFYITLAILGLICLDKSVMHLCSTFSLMTMVDLSTAGNSEEIVYVEKRLLSKSVFRIPLKKIHYIMYHQNICERFFDTGTIRIETSDISGVISIRGIPCIKDKYHLLMDMVKSAV